MNTSKKLMLNALIIAAVAAPSIIRSESAEADVRVQARIRTPNLQVEIGNHPNRHLPRPVIVREHRGWDSSCDLHGCDLHDRWGFRVSRYDRQVARRLSNLSGISRYQLLRAKVRGLSWKQVGRRFGLPRPMLRAALDDWAYDRYCERTPVHARGRGNGRGHGNGHGRHGR